MCMHSKMPWLQQRSPASRHPPLMPPTALRPFKGSAAYYKGLTYICFTLDHVSQDDNSNEFQSYIARYGANTPYIQSGSSSPLF